MMMPRGRNKALIALNRTALAWVLSGCVLCAMAALASPTSSANPYHEITERNVFGLRPPQPSRVESPPTPLPKIVLTGITTILGNKRALLKVQYPAQPPEPAKEESCILAEGQREGAIEVLAINAKTEHVKVDNSGTVSVITFEKAVPTPPAVARPQPRPYWPRLAAQAALRKY